MQPSTIGHDVTYGVLVVTLNRPDQLNAFTPTMADELEETFVQVNDDDSHPGGRRDRRGPRVLRGDGPQQRGRRLRPGRVAVARARRHAGPHLPELRRVRDTGGRVTLAIHECRKPVIAAINGAAVGIGATMTLAMDARLMSSKARFGLVFGRLGIVPEAASTWFLPRIVGMPKALDLVYHADILDSTATAEGPGSPTPSTHPNPCWKPRWNSPTPGPGAGHRSPPRSPAR